MYHEIYTKVNLQLMVALETDSHPEDIDEDLLKEFIADNSLDLIRHMTAEDVKECIENYELTDVIPIEQEEDSPDRISNKQVNLFVLMNDGHYFVDFTEDGIETTDDPSPEYTNVWTESNPEQIRHIKNSYERLSDFDIKKVTLFLECKSKIKDLI